MTIGPWEGRRLAEIPLLGGHAPVATGAISLAQQCGAPILPVFALRQAGTDRFALRIEPPLRMSDSDDKSAPVISACRDYAARLEPYVRDYPDQWRGWSEWQPSTHRSP